MAGAGAGGDLDPTVAELGRKFETARSEMSGERREVAVLFADICGSTTISEQLDPEEIGFRVNRLLQELGGAVQHYGGHVDKFIGDAVMALFGAPVAHEDDPDRAVLAALDMLKVVRRHAEGMEAPLRLRIGINLGEVVAGTVGSGQGVQYTVMGDAVNVASRLEHEAVPNTVLVSESLARRLSGRFAVEPLGAVELRGRSEPIRTCRVTGFHAEFRPAAEPRTPFVGRAAELEQLGAFLGEVAAGRGGALVVEAEPGTGKSRLVREALGRAGSELVVLETGFSSIQLPGQRPALAELFRQVVPEAPAGQSAAERALAFLGPEAEAQRAGIEGLAHEADPTAPEGRGAGGEAAAARQERWLALAALLRRAAAERRGVLVWIEDVHWMDEGTQEFLDFLAPRLGEQALGLLLTSRPRG
ncbi:MAG TPA: adenylate/guanylate cyclase domain-containing protein, partial [Gemmatimonadota bacterium]